MGTPSAIRVAGDALSVPAVGQTGEELLVGGCATMRVIAECPRPRASRYATPCGFTLRSV